MKERKQIGKWNGSDGSSEILLSVFLCVYLWIRIEGSRSQFIVFCLARGQQAYER